MAKIAFTENTIPVCAPLKFIFSPSQIAKNEKQDA
jgi:hypothetical protein